MNDAPLLERLAVENFLYHEAKLLDAWRLDDWLALFTDDCSFVVPSTDKPNGDPAIDLTLLDDNHERLCWRVERLKSRHAHREFPYSRTRRLITNVCVVESREAELDVEAGVVLYRYRHRRADHFVGSYHHTLVRDGGSFRFRRRRAELDQETLSPNGALSMIF
jgi:p-cumate 2,3-dioxygenase beta subunit